MRACLKEMKEIDEKLRADLAIFGLSYDESVDLSKLENVCSYWFLPFKLDNEIVAGIVVIGNGVELGGTMERRLEQLQIGRVLVD